MKRIALILAAVMATCAMAIGFVGCSGGGTHNDAGTYNVYSLSQGNTVISNDVVKALEMEDYIILDLKSDGKGTLSYNDESSDLTWKDGELSHGSEKLPYTKEGGMIVITIDDTSVTLQKKQ